MEKVKTGSLVTIKENLMLQLKKLFNIREDMISRAEIDEMMEENTVIHGSNMWILIMAILIASIGLYANSVAVIIGAMLISPLMNGILTMGYSLAVRDLDMLLHAFRRFSTQVIISIIASTLFFWLAPLEDPTAEMIARTSPTFWDVLIALFGGVAGVIGNTRRKKGNVIPGVAIATALMPPVCTVGYGIATLQPRFILGAFYLFLINTLLIGLSACIITGILGVPPRVHMDEIRQKKINRIVALITALVVIPSILTGAHTIYTTHIENQIEAYLETEFVFSDTQLVRSNVNNETKTISVALVGTTISDETIDVLRGQLAGYGLDGYTLRVTQNSVLIDLDDEDDDADKTTIAIQENTITELKTELEEKQSRLDELEASIAAQVDFKELSVKAEQVFAEYFTDCSCGVIADNDGEYVAIIARAARELTEDEIALVVNWAQVETGIERADLWITGIDEPETQTESSP